MTLRERFLSLGSCVCFSCLSPLLPLLALLSEVLPSSLLERMLALAAASFSAAAMQQDNK